MTVPIKLAWDVVEDADRYEVNVIEQGTLLSEKANVASYVTQLTEITVQVQARTLYRVCVFSARDMLVSIDCAEIMVYATRW